MAHRILIVNGSPHTDGCTARALEEVERTLRDEGIETELLQIGKLDIRGCAGCNACRKLGRCVFDDIVNETAEKFREADGLIVGSPVYYSSPNATLIAFLDRLFYSSRFSKSMKVGAAVVSCRRAGSTASLDVLNKYFTIAGMPVASSTYWNMVHGFTAEDVEKDAEGLQTMRNLAHNAAFLVKAIADGKEKYGPPIREKGAVTNFQDGK